MGLFMISKNSCDKGYIYTYELYLVDLILCLIKSSFLWFLGFAILTAGQSRCNHLTALCPTLPIYQMYAPLYGA